MREKCIRKFYRANEVVAEGGNLQDHLWPNKRLPEHESYPYPKGYWNPNDFPEDFNPLDLLEDVPCTACKRNKRSGRFCRQELNHEAPNWNYKDPSEGLIPKIEPVDPSKVNDPEVMLAAFQKFQRELRELERQRQEREEQQKLQQAEDEAKEGSEVQPSGAPVPNRGRRHWTEEVGNTFNNSVSLNILLRSIDSAWKPSQGASILHLHTQKGKLYRVASVQRNIKKLPVRQSVYAVVADRPICPFADHVGTRTSEQVRSHLNKYRKRLAREAQRAVDAALATENAVATQSPAGNPSAPFRSAHVAEGDPPSSTPAKGGSLPVVQTVSTAATRLAEPNHSPHIGDDASAAV